MIESALENDSPIVLSIVIPAFNEAERISTSLAMLREYLATKGEMCEVIVVDDGSSDDTARIVREWSVRWPALRLIAGEHRGKGAAVRVGALAAQGRYVAIADADFSMPAVEFDRFSVDAAGSYDLGPYDLVIGSREAPGAVRYHEPMYRHLMGRVFNAFVRLVALSGIQDTQCGFKCMRREVAQDLCQHQTIAGWGFDVELLYIARLRGYRVREAPISWYYAPGSRVQPLRDTFTMVRDVLAIRRNGQRGLYAHAVVTPSHAAVVR